MDKLDKIMEEAMVIVEADGISNIVGTNSHIEADCEDRDVLYHLVLNGNINNLDDIECDCGQEMCPHRLAFVIELNKKMENSKSLMLENAFNGALSWQGIKDFVELAINYNEELYNYFLDMVLYEENGGINFKGELEYERIDEIFHEYSQTGFILKKNYPEMMRELKEEITGYEGDVKSLKELAVYLLKLMARYQYDFPIEFYRHGDILFHELSAKISGDKGEYKSYLNNLINLLKDPETIYNEILIGNALLNAITTKVQARAIQKIIKERIQRLIPVVQDNQAESLPVEISDLCESLNRLNVVTRTSLELSPMNTAKIFYQLQPKYEIYRGIYELVNYFLENNYGDYFSGLIEYTFKEFSLPSESFSYLKDLFNGIIIAIEHSKIENKDDYFDYFKDEILEKFNHEFAIRLLWELNL